MYPVSKILKSIDYADKADATTLALWSIGFGYAPYRLINFYRYPMKPNIHQFPEDADAFSLLQYKIAVQQACLDGRPVVECRRTILGHRYAVEFGVPVEAPSDGEWAPCKKFPPVFNWAIYDYRIMAPKVVPTSRFFCFADGTLFGPTDGEDSKRYCLEAKPDETVVYLHLDGHVEPAPAWTLDRCVGHTKAGGSWKEFDGSMEGFRPKPKLAVGHNPAKLTEDQIGAGYRTLSLEEAAYLQDAAKRDNTTTPEGIELYGGEWKPAPWCGDSPTRTYRTQKPSGFYLPKPKLAPGEVCGRGPTVNVLKGHNPENLTAQQLEADRGWRLLSSEEHEHLASLNANAATRSQLPLHGSDLMHLNSWEDCRGEWLSSHGGRSAFSYRTKKPAGWYTAAQEHGRQAARMLEADANAFQKSWGFYVHPLTGREALRRCVDKLAVFDCQIAEGHNPPGLTNAEVGVSEGWRLLSADEIRHRKSQPALKRTRNIQNICADHSLGWSSSPSLGDEIDSVYRTKLPAGHFLSRPKPTTVRGWLETLPSGYRERALQYCNIPDVRATSLSGALQCGFLWEDAPEGDVFWCAVKDWVFNPKANQLPRLPKP